MAKIFAVTIILIAIGSAIPIVMHTWHLPQDISTHGPLIDEQYAETMAEAGISFLASQIPSGFLHLEVLERQGRIQDAKLSWRRQRTCHRCVSAGRN